MNKIGGLIIVFVALLTVSVSCQNLNNQSRSGNQHIEQMNQTMKSELNLDQKQEIAWDEIYNKYKVRFKNLKEDESLDRDAKKENAKSLFAEMDTEVLSILNDDQKQEYKVLVKQNRAMAKEKYRKRKGQNSGQGKEQNRGQSIKNELSLSEEQSQKWDKINADYRSKKQGIKNGSYVNNDEKRKEINNLMGEMNSEILAILDSKQQASYLQLVEERRDQAKGKKNKNK